MIKKVTKIWLKFVAKMTGKQPMNVQILFLRKTLKPDHVLVEEKPNFGHNLINN